MLAELTSADVFIFTLIFLIVLAALAFFSWFSWRLSQRTVDPCPYTGLPLRRGSDIGFYHSEKIYKFLNDHRSFDNPLYDLNKASFCRDTGRIFPDSINWLDCVRVDWSFIQKRHRGNYVSWGSLTQMQQDEIRRLHGSLNGFQTDYSSPEPNPRLIEPDYAFAHPGPLYVEISTNTLLGWKNVPDTDFEVLIVQKPLNIIYQKPT
jgi:hypothetical protein